MLNLVENCILVNRTLFLAGYIMVYFIEYYIVPAFTRLKTVYTLKNLTPHIIMPYFNIVNIRNMQS